MKYIELTQGMRTMVDDDLYEWLNQWKWYYRKRSKNRPGGDVVRTLHGYDKDGHVKSQTLYMAALICPVPPGFVVDHEDVDPMNNQRNNLRKSTYRNNTLNTKARVNNQLKEKNIHWSEAKQRYVLQVRISGGERIQKYFRDIELAAIVRDELIKKHHGKFGRTE